MRTLLFLGFGACLAFAQRNSGELRLQVVDASGVPVEASAELTGKGTDVHRVSATDNEGRLAIKVLPYGLYKLEVTRPGFSAETSLVDVHSEHPIDLKISLGV